MALRVRFLFDGSAHPSPCVCVLAEPLIGVVVGKVPDKTYDTSVATIKYSLRILLEKDSKESLPTTYEGIYNHCYTAVGGGARGQTLYDGLVMEFEKCCRNLLGELMASKVDVGSIAWLDHVVRVCVWFEGQVVRRFSQPLGYLTWVCV